MNGEPGACGLGRTAVTWLIWVCRETNTPTQERVATVKSLPTSLEVAGNAETQTQTAQPNFASVGLETHSAV